MIRKLLLPLAVAAIAIAVPGCKGSQANTVVSLPPRSGADFVALSFPEGKGASDADRTISSLTKVAGTDNLYLMTYYGDYENIAAEKNSAMEGSQKSGTAAGCTLLSMTGNKSCPVYGRNFDNPPGTGAVLARYRPKNGYASIAFSRMSDLGMSNGFSGKNLSELQEKSILTAPFFALDGVNEKGLAVALAYNPPGVSTEGFQGDEVFITNLMRKLLDNAADVDEANKICRSSKAFDFGVNTVTHHFLIGDSRANAETVEFSGGNWWFMKRDVPYQAVTNIPLYNVPEAQRNAACWRYQKAESMMSGMQGRGSWKDMLNILQAVKQSNGAQTIWSFSADLSAHTIYLCMNGNFSKVFKVNL